MAVESTMLPLGTPVPDFRLTAPATGTMHGPADVAGAEALLVAFVCNHCPYVVHVASAFGERTRQWMDEGLAVLAVNANDVENYPADAPEHMVTFAADHGWTFPYLYDESQEVALTFRAACTPDLFLFDRDRKLAYRGQFDASRPRNDLPVTGDDLDAAVQAVLAGNPVTGDQLPSIGCNIKWKPGNEPEYAP